MTQHLQVLAAVPTLAELQANTATLDQLPLDTLVILRRQVRHLDADLDAAITRLMARAEPRSVPAEQDRLLSPAQAAAMFGVKTLAAGPRRRAPRGPAVVEEGHPLQRAGSPSASSKA